MENTMRLVKSSVMTLTSTAAATRITSSASYARRIDLRARAANAGTVYVGTSSVSTTTGYYMAAGNALSLDSSRVDDLYFIPSAATQTFNYLIWK